MFAQNTRLIELIRKWGWGELVRIFIFFPIKVLQSAPIFNSNFTRTYCEYAESSLEQWKTASERMQIDACIVMDMKVPSTHPTIDLNTHCNLFSLIS